MGPLSLRTDYVSGETDSFPPATQECEISYHETTLGPFGGIFKQRKYIVIVRSRSYFAA
jgi:hypothetical protein